MADKLKYRFGPYRLEAELGAGSFGTVYRAVQEDLGRPVALKVLHGSHRDDPHIRARFTREMRVMMEVNHPGLVKLLDAGDVDGCPYIASDLIVGTDLRQLVMREGPLPEPAVARMGIELASALEYLEGKRMKHRDIKPSNAMRRDDDGATILLDLGLMKAVGDEALTRTGRIVGNFQFMAPEVFVTTEHTHLSDLYAIGGVLFFVLTGQPPLTNDEVSLMAKGGLPGAMRRRELLRAASAPLAAILDSALDADPGQRPRSAGELRSRLESMGQKSHVARAPERRPTPPPTPVPVRAPSPGVPGRIRWPWILVPLTVAILARERSPTPAPAPSPTASAGAPTPGAKLVREILEEMVAEKQIPVLLHPSSGGLHVDTLALAAIESIRGLVLRPAEGWPARFRVALDGHWKEGAGREVSLDPSLLRPGVQILEVETGLATPLTATLFLERDPIALPAPSWPEGRAMTATERSELEAANRIYIARQGSSALEELARKYPEVADIQDRAGEAILHTRLGMQAFAGERLDPATGAREGLVCYQQALRADPRRAEIWVDLARCLRDYREFDLSRRVLATGLILQPEKPVGWKDLGLLVREQLSEEKSMSAARRRRLAGLGARGFVIARTLGTDLTDNAILDEAELWLECDEPDKARALLSPRASSLGATARGRDLARRTGLAPP